MNKIITINLAGQAIAIDEKAYEKLSAYLSTLERHFRNTNSSNEILEDIEGRISEMFDIKLRNGHSFISIQTVDEAIGVMGSPSDMGYEEDAVEPVADQYNYTENRSKKLFRDSEDKVLGGVCSGVAAYFDLDVSLVRLATIILVFFGGLSIIPYIILWIIIPETETPQDRFRMRGETPDIDRIAKRIRSEAEQVADNLKKNESVSRATRGIGDAISRLVKWFGKFFGAAVLIAFVIAAVSITAALFVSMSGHSIVSINGSSMELPMVFESGVLTNFFFLSLLLLLLIPIVTIMYLLVCFIFNLPMQRVNLKAIFATWLLCLALFVGISIYGSSQLQLKEWNDFKIELHDAQTVHVMNLLPLLDEQYLSSIGSFRN